jgi:uncharacterized protein involved in exopolysaccharide biosynthesis
MSLEVQDMNAVHQIQGAEAVDIATLWNAIASRKWLLLLSTLLVAILTLFVLSMMSPKYMSEAQVLIEKNESIFMKPQGENLRGQRNAQTSKANVLSQLEVIKSRDLSREVATNLNLTDYDEYNKELRSQSLVKRITSFLGLNPLAGASLEERIIYRLEKNMRFNTKLDTHVISIGFLSKEPELAAKLANGYAEAYMRWQKKRLTNQIFGADDWLGKQTEELRKQVEAAETRVEEFRLQSGITMGRNKESMNVQQLSELNTQLTDAKTQYNAAVSRAALVKKMLRRGQIRSDTKLLESNLVQRLSEQRVGVLREVSRNSSTYRANHPKMIRLKAELSRLDQQIKREMRNIAANLKGEVQIAKERVRSIERDLDAVQDTSNNQALAQAKLRILQQEANSKRQLYEAYVSRYGDASARRTTVPNTVHAEIFQRAYASHIPVSPNKVMIILMAVFATLFLGVAFIITRVLLSSTTINRSMIEHHQPDAEAQARVFI